MKSFCLGIEGIGMHGCVAVLADSTGTILSSSTLPNEPISFHTTPHDLLQSRLRKLIKKSLEKARLSIKNLQDTSVCVGLSGVTFDFDREIDLPRVLAQTEFNIGKLICTGDAEIVFASHARCEHGTAMICGCGSTAYAIKNGKSYRYGGWGPVFGDEGSGYSIGLAALRAVSEEHDRQQPQSILWGQISRWLKDPDSGVPAWIEGKIEWGESMLGMQSHHDPRTAIFNFCFRFFERGGTGTLEGMESWRKVASGLAIPVLRARRDGDYAAEKIIEDAADKLAEQYWHVCDMAKVQVIQREFEPLVFFGGVLTRSSEFRELVLSKIRRKLCLDMPISPILPDSRDVMRPAFGALLFALGDSSTGSLRLPTPKVIAWVLQQAHARCRLELCDD